MADASLPAIFKFFLFQAMASHRDRLPRDLGFAARIAAALSEDCGPCTQLVVDMALRAGMTPQRISALLRGNLEQAGGEPRSASVMGWRWREPSADAVTLSRDR